jgi:hypothetical protein
LQAQKLQKERKLELTYISCQKVTKLYDFNLIIFKKSYNKFADNMTRDKLSESCENSIVADITRIIENNVNYPDFARLKKTILVDCELNDEAAYTLIHNIGSTLNVYPLYYEKGSVKSEASRMLLAKRIWNRIPKPFRSKNQTGSEGGSRKSRRKSKRKRKSYRR